MHAIHATAARYRPFSPAPERPHILRRFSVKLVEFVRPDSFWPNPYSLEQAFCTLQHFVRTGADPQYQSQGQWGRSGPWELMNGSGVVSSPGLNAITGISGLRDVFHRALLARAVSDGQAQWRRDHRIDVTQSLVIPQRVYRPFDGAKHLGLSCEADIHRRLEEMFGKADAGKPMAISLNSVHTDVRTFHGMSVKVTSNGFLFSLKYGDCHPSEFGSAWEDILAMSRTGETFVDTLDRAYRVYRCIVHGEANNCDAGDMHRFYRQDYVSDQIVALHEGAGAEFSSPPIP